MNDKPVEELFGKGNRILPSLSLLLSLSLLSLSLSITKTRLYNFDPLKPHFYIVKLGFTGVYIIFLISAQNIDCRYSLEPTIYVLIRNMKNMKNFYLKIFFFWW